MESYLRSLVVKGWKFWLQDDELAYRAVKNEDTKRILGELKANKAEILRILQERPEALDVAPVSEGQLSLWYDWQRDPGDTRANVTYVTRIRSKVDPTLLHKAVNLVMHRHEILRSIFVFNEGELIQQTLSGEKGKAQFKHVSDDLNDDDDLRKMISADHSAPFDLELRPAVRLSLYTISETHHVMVLSIHHIVVDGVSLSIILRDFASNYERLRRGQDVAHDLPKVKFKEFVFWQRNLIGSERWKKMESYWKSNLLDAPTKLNLPEKNGPRDANAHEAASVVVDFTAELYERLNQFAQNAGATTYTVLLAAYQAILFRYTGQRDLLVGSPLLGRTSQRFSDVVGYFINAVVLRAKLDDEQSFSDLLSASAEQVHGAIENQDYVFSHLVKNLKPKRYAGTTPFFQAWFNLNKRRKARKSRQDEGTETGQSSGLVFEPYEFSGQDADFDLVLALDDNGDSLTGRFKFNSAKYEDSMVQDMALDFVSLLEQVAEKPHIPLKDIFLTADARLQSANELVGESFDLSPQQSRIWRIKSLLPDGPVLFGLAAPGSVDRNRLKMAVEAIVSRHEIFSTRFIEHPLLTRLLQIVEESNLEWPDMNRLCSVTLENDVGEAWVAVCNEIFKEPYSVLDGSTKAHILECRDGKILLVIEFNPLHIDGTVSDALSQQIAAYYRGLMSGDLPETEEPVQYLDVSEWNNELLNSKESGAGKSFWAEHRFKLDRIKPLKLDKVGLDLNRFRPVQACSLVLESNIYRALNEFASDGGVEEVLFAAWQMLLNRLGNNSVPLIGRRFDGRPDEDAKSVVGPLARFLPVPSAPCDGEATFKQMMASNVAVREGISEHQDCFTGPENLSDGNPFAGIPYAFEFDSFGGSEATACSDFSLFPSQVDTELFNIKLSCRDYRDAGKVELLLHVNECAFDPPFGKTLLNQYASLITDILENPGFSVSDAKVSEAHAEEYISLINGGGCAVESSSSIIEVIYQQVRMNPDKIALRCKDNVVSYEEFVQSLSTFVSRLESAGVGSGDFVGVHAARSNESVISMLAIMVIGAVYVPLDPEYPPERLKFMIEDCGLSVVMLGEGQTSDNLGAMIKPISIDLQSVRPDAVFPQVRFAGEDPAYLIYTSGSTGQPKGVIVKHEALAMHCNDVIKLFDIKESDTVLCFAPFSFDPSIEQCIPGLMCGATVQVKEEAAWQPSEIAEKVEEYCLTVVNLPTAFWQLVVQEWRSPGHIGKLGTLRLMIAGGDRMNAEDIRRWQSLSLENVRLFNAYGPTESTITATCAEISKRTELEYSSVPIGAPLGSRRIYILDAAGNPVAPGVEGEIFIGGPAISSGYLNRENLTEKDFAADPFSSTPAGKMYKTGDRGFYDLGGDIYFSGRVDSQVKLNGYRVELLEIQHLVEQISSLNQSAVVLCGDNGENDRKFVVVCYSAERDCDDEIKEALASRLPPFMMPSHYFRIGDWPYGPSGKTDYENLRRWAEEQRAGQAKKSPPKTETEVSLAAIWCEILGVDNVNRSDDFTALGGHSLLLMKLLSRIGAEFSVELKLRDVIQAGDLAALAALIDKKSGSGSTYGVPLVRVDRSQPLPLSFAQKSLWLLSKIGKSRTYQVCGTLRFGRELKLEVLQQCVNILLERHEALRTCFVEKDGEIFQRIEQHVELDIELIRVPSRDKEKQALRAYQMRNFDLGRAPLLRVVLLRNDTEGDCIGVCVHHIISDGISTNILLSEMASVYGSLVGGGSPRLEPLEIQFADYAVWQRKSLTDSVLSRGLDYWCEQLSGYQDLDIPSPRSRPAELSGAGRCITREMSEKLGGGLLELSNALGISQTAVLASAVTLLLRRYSNNQDFCLGMPAASRERQELQKIVGMLVNVLVLRPGAPDGTSSIEDYLKKVHDQIQSALEYQDVPFDKIVGKLKPARDPSRNPIFQALFSYIEFDNGLEFAGEKVVFEHLDSEQARFDLAFDFRRDGRDFLALDLEYSTDLFSDDFVEQLAENFEFILQQIVGRATSSAADLGSVAPSQVSRQIAWGRGPVNEDADPSTKDFVDLIEAQASRNPARPALSFHNDTLDYVQYLAQVSDILERLVTIGADAGSRIAVCVSRSIKTSTAMMAIFRLGAVYVPIDPDIPPSRVAYMLHDCGAEIIIADTRSAELLQSIVDGKRRLLILDDINKAVQNSTTVASRQKTGDVATSPAYIIYTSGSTGNPKGVEVSYGALTYCLYAMQDIVAFGKEDKMLAVASTSFDISLLDLLLPLCNGGESIIADEVTARDSEMLAGLVSSSNATIMQATPSTWEMLFESGWTNPTSARLLSIGEPISEKLHRAFDLHDCRVWNGYGPTEATIYTTAKLLEKGRRISIGQAISNYQVYILDDRLEPVPSGLPGELYIGGAALANGYLNKPDLTSRAFLDNPFSSGQKLYKSGDLVRWISHDGEMELEFLGRIDDQIKLRGYRIELGEIEATLDKIGSFSQTAVLVVDSPIGPQLVAFLVARQDAELPEDSELKQRLAEWLPNYMVPDHFHYLNQMPLTASHKLDKSSLRKTELDVGFRPAQAEPRPLNKTEQELAALWKELFGCDHVEVSDNFFEMGGHSLSMVRLHNKIQARLAVRPPLSSLFLNPVLSQMAAVISRASHRSGHRIEPYSESRVSPLSVTQEGIWLADQIAGGTSAFNLVSALRIRGELVPEVLLQAWQAVQWRQRALRGRCRFTDGEAKLIIADSVTPHIPISEIDGLSEVAQKSELARCIEGEFNHVFDLEHDELVRLQLFKLGPEDVCFVLNVHHILIDGWSIRLLLREFISNYDALAHGHEPEPVDLSVHYTDFARWQREMLKKGAFDDQVEFWRGKLRNCPKRSALPYDKEPTGRKSYEGGVVYSELAPGDLKQLREFAASNSTTLFNVMLSAWKILLHIETGETDILIGTDVAYRIQPELEPLIGCFVNQVPLRSKIDPATTLQEFVEQTATVCVEAYSNQELPFETLIGALGLEPRGIEPPLFQSKFFMDSRPEHEMGSDIMEISPLNIRRESARLPLNFSWLDTGDSVTGKLVYNVGLFSRETVERLERRYMFICGRMAKESDTAIDDFHEYLVDAEYESEMKDREKMRQEKIKSFKAHNKRVNEVT